MKITVIHGQSHKGSTYHITSQIIDKISSDEKEVFEYFMPIDTPDYCIGCYKCFFENENACPHAEKVQTIVNSMEISDVIIIDSPTYSLEMTGQLKTFFDHIAYMWLPHRPRQSMFTKVGIAISTTAGAGAGKVAKSIARQMFYIGIPKVFKYGRCVNAQSWEKVSDKIKESIAKDTLKLSAKVNKKAGKARPGFKLKFMFYMMKMMQKSNNWNLTDKNYWNEKGWLDGRVPWKNQ